MTNGISQVGPVQTGGTGKYTCKSEPTYRNIVNLSNYSLTKPKLQVLNMGLSFIPTSPPPPPAKYSSEALVEDFNTLCKTHMARYKCLIPKGSERHLEQVCDGIESVLSKCSVRKSRLKLPPALLEALSKLKRNSNVIISKADKGDVAVVLDVTKYTHLAWKHLSDTSTYACLDSDPTSQIVETFNYLLTAMCQ